MNEHARNISRTLRTHPGELETDTGETGEIQLTDPDQTTKNYPTESGILFLLLYITFRENFTIGGVTTHFPPSLLQDIIQVFDNSQIEKSSENTINIFFEKLKQSFRENGKQWEGTEEHIASFGPHHQGANVLIFNSKYAEYYHFARLSCLSNIIYLSNYDISQITIPSSIFVKERSSP